MDATDQTATRDRLRSGRFGNTAFTCLPRRTQKDESTDVTPKSGNKLDMYFNPYIWKANLQIMCRKDADVKIY